MTGSRISPARIPFCEQIPRGAFHVRSDSPQGACKNAQVFLATQDRTLQMALQ
jgi:hypothetical protein